MNISNFIQTIIERFCSLFKKKSDVVDESNIDSSADVSYNIDDYVQQTVDSSINSSLMNDSSITPDNETQTTQLMSNYSNITVLIDAGHAKSTGGKRSPYASSKVLPALSLYEYEFNRQLQNVLVKKLNAIGIHTEIITPENDTDVALSTRAARANKIISANPSHHHLFISIHGNAAGNGTKWMTGRGFAVYTTKGQNNSDKFAECICDAAEELLIPKGLKVREDKSDGDKDWEENFTVIYKTNCPAILTENLFYDNVDDCKVMLSDSGKELLADVHVKGIVKYIEKYISVK